MLKLHVAFEILHGSGNVLAARERAWEVTAAILGMTYALVPYQVCSVGSNVSAVWAVAREVTFTIAP